MGSQEWAIIFLVGGLSLSAAEIAAPGLVLLPFGLGAVIASGAGFLGSSPLAQSIIFVVASAILFLALRPVGRRLNSVDTDEGIGARRLVGAQGVVLQQIPADDSGLVRIDRETWRAEAPGDGLLPSGTGITVTEVRGTRLIVTPVAPPSIPPAEPPPPSPSQQTPPTGGNPS